MTIKDCWLKFKGIEIGETSAGFIYVKLPEEQTMRLYSGPTAGGVARNVFCNGVDTLFRKFLTKKIVAMGYDPITGVRPEAMEDARQRVAQADIYTGADDISDQCVKSDI